jgi:diketogulonate reductase-like aldo/keto reductase
MLAIQSVKQLNNGIQIPLLGLGVWQIPTGGSTKQAIDWALAAGYRHIDTAKFYNNEAEVGQAVRESTVSRQDIFVTTKLWGTDQLNAAGAFEASLERLGLDYVDLYLVHWPVPGLVTRTWKEMEKIYATGKAKAIGVSNHTAGQVKAILKVATVAPVVNQIKFSPFGYNEETVRFCQAHDIIIEAYSPLTRGKSLGDPRVAKVATAHGISPAQVMLRWALQKNVVILPKSSNQERIAQNANLFGFELTEEEMEILDELNT